MDGVLEFVDFLSQLLQGVNHVFWLFEHALSAEQVLGSKLKWGLIFEDFLDFGGNGLFLGVNIWLEPFLCLNRLTSHANIDPFPLIKDGLELLSGKQFFNRPLNRRYTSASDNFSPSLKTVSLFQTNAFGQLDKVFFLWVSFVWFLEDVVDKLFVVRFVKIVEFYCLGLFDELVFAQVERCLGLGNVGLFGFVGRVDFLQFLQIFLQQGLDLLKAATLSVEFMEGVHKVERQQGKGVHVHFTEFPWSGSNCLNFFKTQVKLQGVIAPRLGSLNNDRLILFVFLGLGCVLEDLDAEFVFFEDSLIKLFEFCHDLGVQLLVTGEDFSKFCLDNLAQKLNKLHLLILVNIKIIEPFHKTVQFRLARIVLCRHWYLNGFELCFDARKKLVHLELLFWPLNDVTETISFSSFRGPWHKVVKYLHLLWAAAAHVCIL